MAAPVSQRSGLFSAYFLIFIYILQGNGLGMLMLLFGLDSPMLSVYEQQLKQDVYSKQNYSYLANISLVIAYRNSKEFTHALLYDLYYKGFLHHHQIIHCGPFSDVTDQSTVLNISTQHGTFLYDCLMVAMKSHSYSRGYLFHPADHLLVPSNLADLDKTKLWVSPTAEDSVRLYEQPDASYKQDREDQDMPTRVGSLAWWQSRWSVPAVVNVFEHIIKQRSVLIANRSTLNEQLVNLQQNINKWLWNGRGRFHAYRFGAESVIYVPAELRQDFLKLGELFRRYRTRSDIALPTITKILTRDSLAVVLNGYAITLQNTGVREEIPRRIIHEAILTSQYVFMNYSSPEKRQEAFSNMAFKEAAVGMFLFSTRTN